MKMLAEVSDGRDNHFNLIRMIAATAVLVSHAWLIVIGKGTIEPLQAETGHSLGTLAVFVFFAVSGFFITASFARAYNLKDFLLARALRLLPALAVSTWLVALVMGPVVTSLPILTYLTHPKTWEFVLRDSLPISLLFDLPGVFDDLPYPHPVSSIWTLPNEVACYLAVFILGIAGLLRRKLALNLILLGYLSLWLWIEWGDISLHSRLEALRVLSLPFAIGVGFFLWQPHIPITGPLAACLALALFLATVFSRSTPVYEPMLALAIAYITFWVAYLPGDFIRQYNHVGDFSYGIYLYAFPLQGLAVWIFGSMTPAMNILFALPLTLILAIASWYIIEQPALKLRKKRDRKWSTNTA